MNEDRLFHPYGMFHTENSRTLLLGSFPIAKFTNPKLRSSIKAHELDFYYGGEKNKLWSILGRVFNQDMTSKEKIISVLSDYGLSLADVIESCQNRNNSAADRDLYNITWNLQLVQFIQKHRIQKIIFTSKWVEKNFFTKIFTDFKGESVVMLSPSGAANISIASQKEFKSLKEKNPRYTVDDFRLENYRKILLPKSAIGFEKPG